MRYFHSAFFGHACGKDLLKEFIDATKELNTAVLVHVGMDGPGVNKLFFKLLLEDRKTKELNGLVNIGSCNIHNMHGSFKAGAESTGWKIKETLKGAYYLFKDSPARKEDYISQTGCCCDFPFSFCGTRWLDDVKVAKRFLTLFKNLKHTIQFYEYMVESKRPKSKSYCRVRDAVKDDQKSQGK